MDRQTAAFDDANSMLQQLGIPDVLPALHTVGLGISRSVLGGSHSVAVYPPIDSLAPVSSLDILGTIDTGREVSLYVHIPFCETRCTFCHYAVRHYPGKGHGPDRQDNEVAHYLNALKLELAFWGARLADASTAVSSIYIGGGTPLILDQDMLGDLLAAIDGAFDIMPGAELCVEGSPLTVTAPGGEGKLRFLKARGVTRLSFGIQSFDDAVLKYAARGYQRDVAIRATEIASAVFDNWNLDLIQGLYKGSPFETWENLKVVAEVRPPHLTWYHGRFANRPQGDWYQTQSKHASFEDEPATLLGRMLIWRQMAAIGYHQTDGNRFVRERRHVDPFKKIRTSASSNLLGVGASSYSHVGAEAGAEAGAGAENCFGYLFRNDSDIRSYVDRVSAGDVPIATARAIGDEEMLATSYATGLRSGRVESSDLAAIRARKPLLSAHYDALVSSLLDIGILDCGLNALDGPVLHLSDLGRLFEDEALALFFSPSVRTALERGPTSRTATFPGQISVAS